MAVINTIYRDNKKLIARCILINFIASFFVISVILSIYKQNVTKYLSLMDFYEYYVISKRIHSAFDLANMCASSEDVYIFITSLMVYASIPINVISFIIGFRDRSISCDMRYKYHAFFVMLFSSIMFCFILYFNSILSESVKRSICSGGLTFVFKTCLIEVLAIIIIEKLGFMSRVVIYK